MSAQTAFPDPVAGARSAAGSMANADCAAKPAAADAALCYHCGERNPDGRWHAIMNGARRSFCCAGCLAVAQTIHAAGLGAFYAQRTAPGERPVADTAPEADDEWSRWDSAAAQAGLTREVAGGDAAISLLLEGIHCGACIWLLESWLSRQPGVVSAAVNFATRRAQVVFAPGKTRLSSLLRAVAHIGYRAYPYDPARREAFARRESRVLLLRLAVALLAMMQVMMFALPAYVTVDGILPEHRRLLEWASLTLTLPALLYSAAPFFRGAWRDLRLLRPGMDVPVALGLAAAFAASAWATFSGEGAVYYDSVTMFIALLLVARYVELAARRRAGDAVEAVAKARPATALRLRAWPASQEVETVGAASLGVGDMILVRPGALIPADGQVVDGRASVEEAILTGESQPRSKAIGDGVLAGSLVGDGAIVVRVSAAGAATRLSAIERLVDRGARQRPRIARIADRVATWFVAVLLVLAAATALVWWQIDPSRVLAITFAVLVVSCPCALSLATPAALAAASGALVRAHVVVARADALETLARVSHIVVDKTGTLTSGRIALRDVIPLPGETAAGALALAAALEARSEHPLAVALRAGAPAAGLPSVSDLSLLPGYGAEGTLAGRLLRLGRPDWVAALSGRPLPAASLPADPTATVVALGDDGGLRALYVLGDALRPGAKELMERLASLGVTPVLLSGDRTATVAAVADALGIAMAHGEQLPEDKRAAIARLQADGAMVAMAGDGINDAPALAQAQVSVSLGSATPLAQWTADVVVLSDHLPRIADAIAHARRTMRIIRQNLGWACAYNAIAVPAAAMGFVSPLVAAIGMSASSLVVVGNALRLSRLPAPAPMMPILPADRDAGNAAAAAG
jgi:Cu2+-exporting ATPase